MGTAGAGVISPWHRLDINTRRVSKNELGACTIEENLTPGVMLQDLSAELIQEMTTIVFEQPSRFIKPCDVIFVFGGSHPGWWETAAKAYHKGLCKDIVVTGGHKPGVTPHFTWLNGSTPEAHVIRRELVKLSVPENCIFFEEKSINTLENVVFAKEIYDFSRVKRILAVCKNYAAGRQCRTLRWQLDQATEVISYPFDTEAGSSKIFITRDTWMNFEKSRALVYTEVVKIYCYGKLGHLQPLEHMSPELEKLVAEYSLDGS